MRIVAAIFIELDCQYYISTFWRGSPEFSKMPRCEYCKKHMQCLNSEYSRLIRSMHAASIQVNPARLACAKSEFSSASNGN